MKKVTIKDIAQIAGVSRGTVDRVINNRGNVDKNLQQKIERIAHELGYEKNILASNLAINKTHKIAIVTPDPVGDLFWVLPKIGVERALSSIKHYGLEIEYFHFPHYSKDQFVMQLDNALLYKPDCIIIAPTYNLEVNYFFDAAVEQGIAIVCINTETFHPGILCYIGQNSYYSGYLAGRLLHLRLKPHDEIVAINFGHNISNASHYSDKIDGLRAYFSEHNLNENKVFWYEFQYYDDRLKTEQFFKEIQSKHKNLKALFFTNSRAYKLLDLLDIEVCRSLYILGFDMIEPNVNHLKKGKMDFIINQNPIQQGYLGLMSFVNSRILNQKIKSTQYLPLDIVIKENVDFYINADI
jgi:LacI family transcriptional regulator